MAPLTNIMCGICNLSSDGKSIDTFSGIDIYIDTNYYEYGNKICEKPYEIQTIFIESDFEIQG